MPNQRTLLLLSSFSCFAAVAIALYLQHGKNWPPCPLCVIQRYAFVLTGIACLVGASVRKSTPWSALALASTLAGLGVAARQLYVLANPGFSCGIDPMESILNKLPSATLMPWLFKAEGLCEDAIDVFFGLSVPQWSAFGFVAIGVLLVGALLQRRR